MGNIQTLILAGNILVELSDLKSAQKNYKKALEEINKKTNECLSATEQKMKKDLIEKFRIVTARISYKNNEKLLKENQTYEPNSTSKDKTETKSSSDKMDFSKEKISAILDSPNFQNLAKSLMENPDLVSNMMSSFMPNNNDINTTDNNNTNTTDNNNTNTIDPTKETNNKQEQIDKLKEEFCNNPSELIKELKNPESKKREEVKKVAESLGIDLSLF